MRTAHLSRCSQAVICDSSITLSSGYLVLSVSFPELHSSLARTRERWRTRRVCNWAGSNRAAMFSSCSMHSWAHPHTVTNDHPAVYMFSVCGGGGWGGGLAVCFTGCPCGHFDIQYLVAKGLTVCIKAPNVTNNWLNTHFITIIMLMDRKLLPVMITCLNVHLWWLQRIKLV